MPPSPPPPLRVLIVDDERDAADSLKVLVGLWGHDACAAYGGEEALGLAGAFRPHVVLLDVAMPGMDGREVARRLRADPVTAGARVLAVSGYGQREEVQKSLDAGFHGHITKPAEPSQLQLVLERLAAALPPEERWA
jgi:CheY-like chemotaxis protein